MDGKYDFTAIEAKWQRVWEEQRTFEVGNPGEPGFDASKPKYFCLDFFPYPSGAGLHVGHPEGYTATDVLARWRRMRGFNVLHPMAWDAFGLPAEQYAVETNTHPAITTTKNIATFKRQLKALGFSYDWSREFATTDPDYVRWTQWIFLQLFNSYYDEAEQRARPISDLVKKLESEKLVVRMDGTLAPTAAGMQQISGIPIGNQLWHELTPDQRSMVLDQYRLAYVDEAPVNWCPALGTVLSNEEVTNEGRSERGNHPVFRRPLKQWMLRITAYADRLISDLEPLDWPEAVKLMQRNWIGRSEGAEVEFEVEGEDESITVFTTRPDTLFGATYVVLSPEHDFVLAILNEDAEDDDAKELAENARMRAQSIVSEEQADAVRAYIRAAAKKSERDRTADAKKKTGVFTGRYAINPVNNACIPIWVADYVLTGYGTGAIMAVPGHDIRDYEFAKTFGLPILQVVSTDSYDEMAEGSFPLGKISERSENGKKYYTVEDAAFDTDGFSINSPPSGSQAECEINWLKTPEAKKKITAWLESKNLGKARVQYKLRDWLFSRQRYWGEPFPVVHGEDGAVYAVADSELPVTLPEVADFQPTALAEDSNADPEPPLGRAKDWVNVRFWLDDESRAHVHAAREAEAGTITYAPGRKLLSGRRETNTMPNWAGSCWYYLRYCDPKNAETFCSKAAEQYWMLSKKRDGTPHFGGVDLYLGGTEHAVLHLLYARFWHKVLFDLGYASTPEPFGKLYNQGMIRAFAYRDERGVPHGYEEIDFRDDGAFLKATGEKLAGAVEKMSKTLKNVINPDDVVRDWGADSLRLYELFMGPLDASKPWNPRDVPGVFRFLQRVWRLVVDPETGDLNAKLSGIVSTDRPALSERPAPSERAGPSPAPAAARASDPVERALHRAIKKVTEDLTRMAYNTAIAAMMEFVNVATSAERLERDQIERFVLILSPFAPHISEELWGRLTASDQPSAVSDQHRAAHSHHPGSLAYEPWPVFDESLTVENEIEIPVQVNGKIKARLTVPRDADEAALEAAARADAAVAAAIDGKTVRKVVVVPGRMVNIVVS